MTPQPPTVLILSAAIGEGHDLPARAIADGVRLEAPAARVEIADGLDAMGWPFASIAHGGSRFHSAAGLRMFDVEFWLVSRFPPTRALAGATMQLVGGGRLVRFIDARAPDVVVSTYPGVTELLGRLRLAGRLRAPVVSAITDLAALRFWAHPGVDLHLVTHRASVGEVLEIAPGTRVVCARGMTSSDFERPRDRAAARADLELPPGGRIALVSGGGWAVGDLEGAVEIALDIPGLVVVCLCGRNEAVRAAIEARFAGEPRVRAWGYTDRMSDLFAAADVLVHSTAGLTVLEANVRGCPAISYGWGAAHIRANNRAYARFGLAEVAATPFDLALALRRALAGRPPPDSSYAELPSAASLVLAAARG